MPRTSPTPALYELKIETAAPRVLHTAVAVPPEILGALSSDGSEAPVGDETYGGFGLWDPPLREINLGLAIRTLREINPGPVIKLATEGVPPSAIVVETVVVRW